MARPRIGDAVTRGVRVQSPATAAGRADRRPLLPGGRAAVPPADAAAGAVGVAHRQPRGAVPHPRFGTGTETAEYADGCVVTMPTRAWEFGYPLRTRSVGVHVKPWGAGAVPADARGRVV
ncbi:hypothetical protein ACFSTC_60720 [Nonomuraea ferruginea]